MESDEIDDVPVVTLTQVGAWFFGICASVGLASFSIVVGFIAGYMK